MMGENTHYDFINSSKLMPNCQFEMNTLEWIPKNVDVVQDKLKNELNDNNDLSNVVTLDNEGEESEDEF